MIKQKILRKCKACLIKITGKEYKSGDKYFCSPECKKQFLFNHRPIKRLRKDAWDLMSEWSRRKWADENGLVACVTCGKKRPWKEMDAGHLFHRNALDFEEKNINPQDYRCNKVLSGNATAYIIWFIGKYGTPELERLNSIKNIPHKFTREELETIISDLKNKLDNLNKL